MNSSEDGSLNGLLSELADAQSRFDALPEGHGTSAVAVLGQCESSVAIALNALEEVVAAIRRRGGPVGCCSSVPQAACREVVSHATGLIMSSIQHAGSIHAAAPLVNGAVVGRHPSSSTTSQDVNSSSEAEYHDAEEQRLGVVLHRWKGVCALAVSQLLQVVQPSVFNSAKDDESERESSKQVIAAARSLSRHLGTDLCMYHCHPSLLEPLRVARYPHLCNSQPEEVPGNHPPTSSPSSWNGWEEPALLWSRWVPTALEKLQRESCHHENGSGGASCEVGRVAVLLLDALRRWCHDVLDWDEHHRDSEVSHSGAADPSSPSDHRQHIAQLISPAALSSIEILYNEVCRHTAASKAGQTSRTLLSVGGLPSNVMEGFISVWPRLAARAGVSRLRMDGVRDAPCPPGVERTLDLSMDDGNDPPARSFIAQTGRELEDISSWGLPIDTQTVAEKAAHTALAGFCDGRRMLTEDEVKRVMHRFTAAYDTHIREVQSRVATLEAHNKNLAARVVSCVVTARTMDGLYTVSAPRASENGGEVSPLDDSQPLAEATSSSSRAPSSFENSRPSSTWASGLVDEVFDVAAFLNPICSRISLNKEPLEMDALSAVLDAAVDHWIVAARHGENAGVLAAKQTPTSSRHVPTHGGRVRSSSAIQVLSHDDQLAEQEAEVDRLMKEARALTPRCRAGSRPPTARRTPLETTAATPGLQCHDASIQRTDPSDSLLSPMSEEEQSPNFKSE